MGNRPGIGDIGTGNRPSTRPSTPEGRRDNLQDRLASRDQIGDRNREDRQDRRDDREGRRDDRREDWQDWRDDISDRHDDWHNGYWHGDAGGWWDHMWEDHTALMAFGVTMWGLNRMAYGFGYWGYENPYYYESYPVSDDVVLDYSQPVAAEIPADAAVPPPSDAPQPGMTDFDAAREAFYKGDYAAAMASTNKALAAMPSDAIMHEFRALVLFAQAKYKDSAAGLYSVLAVGPGWDWTTLSSLYPNVDVYTKQLRALEAYCTQNRQDASARFVLAYHYLTMGSKDAAATIYKDLYRQLPQDNVTKELLLMSGGPDALGTPAPATDAAKPDAPVIPTTDLVGKWSAAGTGNSKFQLDLTKEGKFTWTYTQGGKDQTVKGVFAMDKNVLAMEPDSGGVMLAELTPPKSGSFQFQMLGAPPGDKGLKFTKQ